jgi:hypothetical protein
MTRLVFEYVGPDRRWVEMTTYWLSDPYLILRVVERAVSSPLLAMLVWRVRIRSVARY